MYFAKSRNKQPITLRLSPSPLLYTICKYCCTAGIYAAARWCLYCVTSLSIT